MTQAFPVLRIGMLAKWNAEQQFFGGPRKYPGPPLCYTVRFCATPLARTPPLGLHLRELASSDATQRTAELSLFFDSDKSAESFTWPGRASRQNRRYPSRQSLHFRRSDSWRPRVSGNSVLTGNDQRRNNTDGI